ncbi:MULTISPECIES: DUF1634 domain-containing protein [unclassified Dysgonomonas]|uniref:DUF1634 domain-containing protein n=1 Tax=unclassified Dysgonomonas TaxID=2630389 RepID=UPI0006831516|nr:MULTISPECIES: DUF1634 domain-containing protein [unclassified Dysgonomonas]MBD8348946.1 DUF1634 domain-containing protein [Dysgonomonas sp. HGC4]MBF0576428.1 DUF1634 domain-containing protein [Dysgonomonas sp. GY617]
MKHIFSREFWGERDVEQYIGKLLRYGVMLSCAITIFGGIIYLYQHKGVMVDYSPVPTGMAFGVDEYLRELNTIFPRMLDFDGAAIVQFGVLVLIATPIIRVAFSAFSFLIEKDYLYVVITLIVLAIILANMFLGLH